MQFAVGNSAGIRELPQIVVSKYRPPTTTATASECPDQLISLTRLDPVRQSCCGGGWKLSLANAMPGQHPNRNILIRTTRCPSIDEWEWAIE